MNNVQLLGRLVQVPEVVERGENRVLNNAIAIDNGKDKDATFINIVAWNGVADIIAKYIEKGDQFIVSNGQLQSNNYTKEDGTKVYNTQVLITEIKLLDNRKRHGAKSEAAPDVDVDDQLPF